MTDVVRAARDLGERLAARADEIEHARRLPADLSATLAAAGFYRMFVPAALGGLEVSPVDGVRALECLAVAEASCAWVAFIGATTGSALVRVPEEAARAIFSRPDTMITGVFAPTGTAERVDGGFRVSGRWQWGSGCQNADWIAGGCAITEGGTRLTTPDGAPRNHMLLFRAADVEILDTWHVAGLRGTGSTDYQVHDVFVPDAHAIGWLVPDMPARPLYQFPFFTFLALGVAAVALGIARAALTDLVALAAGKRRAGSASTIASRSHSHMEVALAEAELRSARAFLYESLASAWTEACAGQPIGIAARRDVRLATTHAVQRATRVVDTAYTLAGGAAVYESSRLQRHLRDVHVTTQHIMVGPGTLETVGRLFLGVDANTATL
jgi:alkylation response protein AidB-like acyl-CoA dehydrogenase